MSAPINLNYAGAYLPLSGSPRHWLNTALAGVLAAPSGNTALYGNGSAETLVGGAGDDTFYIYGAEKVVEPSSQGVDTIVASWTNVTLPTNVNNLFINGNFTAYGNSADDVIVGDKGNQVLVAGTGNDVLTGGGGKDTFVFNAGSGHDVITDFTPGAGSVVRLAGYTQFTSLSDVTSHMTQQGSDVVLTLDDHGSVTFRNTTIGQFSASDFYLAIDPSTKQQTFSEDFNSLSLWSSGSGGSGGSGTWLPYFTYAGNSNALGDRTLYHGEQEIYVDPTMAGQGTKPLGLNPFSVSGGVLTITAAPTPAADVSALYGYKYTSGVLTTQKSFSQEYGYFEIDAKIPTAAGVWPSFWLLPSAGGWPPEIDVMESDGGGGGVGQSIHTGKGNTVSTVTTNLGASAGNAFHTYGVLWDANHITFYIDHVETGQFATPADMHQAMYMLVNLAVTPNAPASSFPASMQIDSIKAYSLADAPSDVKAAAAAPAAPASPDSSQSTITTTTSGATTTANTTPTSTSPSTTASATGETAMSSSYYYKLGNHVWGGSTSTTYTVGSAGAATVAKPFSVASFDASKGDLIDLTKVDANPATKAIDAWTLVQHLQGHAGQAVLVQLDNHGDWAFEGDTTGSGHANFIVDIHATGSQTAWVDVASHLLL